MASVTSQYKYISIYRNIMYIYYKWKILYTLEEKYQRLIRILTHVKENKKMRSKVKIVKMSESEMGYPQPLI